MRKTDKVLRNGKLIEDTMNELDGIKAMYDVDIIRIIDFFSKRISNNFCLGYIFKGFDKSA